MLCSNVNANRNVNTSNSHLNLHSNRNLSSAPIQYADQYQNDRHLFKGNIGGWSRDGNQLEDFKSEAAFRDCQDDNFLSSAVHFANKRLCYSNQRCNRLPEVIVKLYSQKAHSMDLSYNDLVTTRGIECFAHLRELVLDNNQLNDNVVVPYLPHLHTLSLNKNLINDIELLMEKLTHSMPALTFLSLLGNKACPNQLSDITNDDDDYARYRCYVLSRLPNLDFLDSTRVSNRERHLASKKGQFMKVVRPKEDDVGDGNSRGSTQDDSPPGSYYSPLPRTMRRPDDHKGAYSRCKYKYSGKHSEGNRFISNNDL